MISMGFSDFIPHFCLQNTERQALQSVREHKSQSDTQHETEITALSGNLAAVRQQLESSKRRARELEATVKSQAGDIQGVCVSGFSVTNVYI